MEASVIQGGGQIRVFHDLETLSRAAADLLFTLAHLATASRGRFALALSGGSTPKQLYALLGTSEYRNKIPWKGVHVFWADERAVPKEHGESNFKLAYETFLSKVPLPKENMHRIAGEKDPAQAAHEYENEIRALFRGSNMPVFDLVILGMGEDGHTASLFPGSPELNERSRLAVPAYPAGMKTPRVTLTLPVLNQAAHVLFLVSGSAKAQLLHDILEGGKEDQYPAGLVRPVSGGLEWMMDREAAVNLTFEE